MPSGSGDYETELVGSIVIMPDILIQDLSVSLKDVLIHKKV